MMMMRMQPIGEVWPSEEVAGCGIYVKRTFF
jgi:hypothetical protein